MTQIEATRGPIRPLLLAIWPRPLAPCWRAPEPPVRGERHSAEDRRLHPRRQNHLRAQQTDPGCHEAAREGLTEAVSTIREGRKRNPEPRGETFAWPNKTSNCELMVEHYLSQILFRVLLTFFSRRSFPLCANLSCLLPSLCVYIRVSTLVHTEKRPLMRLSQWD